MKSMRVKSRVSLSTEAGPKHIAVMLSAAQSLTNDPNSVHIYVPPDDHCSVEAEFTMNHARQMDVVDHIMHTFAMDMDDYDTQDIWFPKGIPFIVISEKKVASLKDSQNI